MSATFTSGQTLVKMHVLVETVETFGGVKVELVAPDAVIELEESLHQFDLGARVFDQLIAVDDVQLPAREHVQPPAQEFRVQRDVQRPVLRVHLPRR